MAGGRSDLGERLGWHHTSAIMAMIEVMHSTGGGRLDLMKWHPDRARSGQVMVGEDNPEAKSFFKEAVLAAAGKGP